MRVELNKVVEGGGVWLTVIVECTNSDGLIDTDEDTVFITKADLEEAE